MATRLLFLDIDGVLNCDTTKVKSKSRPIFTGLEPRLLNMFLTWRHQKKDLEIVLSSSWRKDVYMTSELREAGIDWVGHTPHLPSQVRGAEIASYMEGVKYFGKFAILDDTSDMLGYQLPFFVQTSYVHGLRERNLDKLDQILYN